MGDRCRRVRRRGRDEGALLTAPDDTFKPPDLPSATLAEHMLAIADNDFRGYTPLYDCLVRGLVTDDELMGRLVDAPDTKRMPVNFLAAAHFVTLREPTLEISAYYRGEAPAEEAWPVFRAFLTERLDDIFDVMATHNIQTNEVGRSAVLVPAFTRASRLVGDRPLALVEIGPSAGLNLLFDRYRIQYSDGRVVGDAASPLTIDCELVNEIAVPLPPAPLDVRSRTGIDLEPVDVHDEDACLWLQACIWPDVPGRLHRLRTALDVARREAPPIRAGDGVDLLPSVLTGLPDDVVPVVFTSWVLAYLPKEGRQAIHDIVGSCGRDAVLVTAEFPHVTPWLRAPRETLVEGKVSTLLGLAAWVDGAEQDEPLAWVHPHGTWIDWMQGELR